MQEWTAAFLEAAGPLTVLGAQVIYLTQPFLRSTIPDGHLDTLARLLEEPELKKAFITDLRREDQLESA